MPLTWHASIWQVVFCKPLRCGSNHQYPCYGTVSDGGRLPTLNPKISQLGKALGEEITLTPIKVSVTCYQVAGPGLSVENPQEKITSIKIKNRQEQMTSIKCAHAPRRAYCKPFISSTIIGYMHAELACCNHAKRQATSPDVGRGARAILAAGRYSQVLGTDLCVHTLPSSGIH
jgi:hypothetical protein